MRPVDWVLRLKQAPHLPEIHVIGLGVAAKQKIAFSGIRDRTQEISNPKDRVLLLCSDIDIADVNIGRQFVVLEGIAEATGMSGLGQGGGLWIKSMLGIASAPGSSFTSCHTASIKEQACASDTLARL